MFLGEKPYKCRFCAWATISATSLKAHMKNHTNKHPFGCAQCHLGFKLKQDLIKHCQTAHGGVLMLQDGNSATENDNAIPEAEPNTVSSILLFFQFCHLKFENRNLILLFFRKLYSNKNPLKQ